MKFEEDTNEDFWLPTEKVEQLESIDIRDEFEVEVEFFSHYKVKNYQYVEQD